MVPKMIVLAMCMAVAYGGAVPLAAAKYPAGVNPHACPNYPYCDNVALAGHGHHGAVAPYAAPAYAAYGHHAGVHGPGGPKAYPAGVDPHVCPNYPFCGPTPAAHHGGWAGAGAHHGGWAGAGAHHGGWAGAGAHHGGWAGAGAHHGWDDGSWDGDDGSYHGEDDGSYNHWDDGSHGHWDDGSYHHGGHHW